MRWEERDAMDKITRMKALMSLTIKKQPQQSKHRMLWSYTPPTPTLPTTGSTRESN